MRAPDGRSTDKRGVYHEVVPPGLLVFTYAWEDANGDTGPEMRVTVTFAARGQKTLLTLHQTGFDSAAARDLIRAAGQAAWSALPDTRFPTGGADSTDITMTSNQRSHIMVHPIVSSEEWLAARRRLLVKEKALTRMRDELNAERRALPWVKVEKDYVFEGPNGRETLADLFDGRSQLVVKHFMFGPDWSEGCVGCSFEVDHIGGALVHLNHHDVTYVAVVSGAVREAGGVSAAHGLERSNLSRPTATISTTTFMCRLRPEETRPRRSLLQLRAAEGR